MKTPKTIAVGTDLSDLAQVAVDTAFALARRMSTQRVHLVHVLKRTVTAAPYPFAYEAEDLARIDERRHKNAATKLKAMCADHPNATWEIRDGIPSRDLAAAAADVAADLIVVSSHGYGPVRRALLGSVAASLIRTSEVPTLIVGAKRRGMDFEVVVAGVDLSKVSQDVLDLARTYTTPDGRLHIISAFEQPVVIADDVLPRLPSTEELDEVRDKRVRAIRSMIPDAEGEGPRINIEALAKAPASMAILESAEILAADLIVIGTSGHSAWHRVFIGSTANRVLAACPCPVLVVPRRAR